MSYTFMPWIRQGAAASVATADTLASTLPARATLSVDVTLNNATTPISAEIELMGPGEVTGIDPRQVVRTQPQHLALDVEPNYFAAIEFDRPDLPWLFTPAKAGSADHLRPWICLVAIEKRDGVLAWEAGRPLPTIVAADAAKELPDLADSFAWAHAQISGALGGQALDRTFLEAHPERTVSRLLCPRLLKPTTSYYACVVPTFMAGRQAGLGQDVTMADLTPAWKQSDTNVELPVYYHWEFATGAAGDFAALVKLLEPRTCPPGVGTRPLDISDPGGGLRTITSSAAPVVLGLEGALQPPTFTPTAWASADRATFQQELEELLNAPDTASSTDSLVVVAPPIYGRWHAARKTVPTASGSSGAPPWLRELNLDPRNRVAAAFGTRVVQEQQEELMASAWKQVEEIERANQLLRQAQLARAAGSSLHSRVLSELPAGSLLQLTAPSHSRVSTGTDETARRRIAESALPSGALSPAFRRAVRARGPFARRLLPASRPNWNEGGPGLLERLNGGAITVVPPRALPGGAVSLDAVSVAIGGRSPRRPPVVAADLRYRDLTRRNILAVPASAFSIAGRDDPLTPRDAEVQADNPTAAAFRAAAAEHQDSLEKAQRAPRRAPGPSLDVADVTQRLLTGLDPRTTVPERVLAVVRTGKWEPDDPLEPVMAAPEFPAPMYLPLRELSQEQLLPGLDLVPPNTITVLETNNRFIESYMVGLSHELGRELLWREYPTDQRGTYFRQFWDLRGAVPAPTTEAEREALKDIDRIDEWPDTKHLGDTSGHGAAKDADLVVLIRGELLARYPSATIYAAEAVWSGTKRTPSTAAAKEKYPIFQGKLPADVTFLGFDLTEAQARGSATDTSQHPGWFLVIQQQPTEPRFGLDAATGFLATTPSTWDDLSWGHLLKIGQELYKDLNHAPVSGSRPESWTISGAPAGVSWGKNASSAHIAWIALQSPVRIAIHFDDMLPEA